MKEEPTPWNVKDTISARTGPVSASRTARTIPVGNGFDILLPPEDSNGRNSGGRGFTTGQFPAATAADPAHWQPAGRQ
jgi:hypothetical protein